jgi:N-acetyl-anhydromuramyl-L-alanine amidase AmpD
MPLNIQRTHRSPNYNKRPHGILVSAIVLHADGASAVSGVLDYLCTPGAAQPPVSYHALIGRTGVIYELVDPQLRAWHAGVSALDGVANCNDYTVGVCLSNAQNGREPFTEAAMRAGAEYCALLMREFPAITLERVVMHSDVALPKGRKSDPAPAGPFDLHEFRNLVTDYRMGMAA